MQIQRTKTQQQQIPVASLGRTFTPDFDSIPDNTITVDEVLARESRQQLVSLMETNAKIMLQLEQATKEVCKLNQLLENCNDAAIRARKTELKAYIFTLLVDEMFVKDVLNIAV